MAVTVASFRTAFPEFTDAPEAAVVQRALTTAALIVDLSTGSAALQDDALSYMAAHILSQDPRGEKSGATERGTGSQLAAKSGRTARGTSVYLETYERLVTAHVCPLVIG